MNEEESSKPQTINDKPETTNMEVHKHPHHVTHKKRWGEYLLEFLMLFLAVFLGFVAENLREHQAEHQREKQYIQSLIADLKTDDSAISYELISQQRRTEMMDSMITLLNDPLRMRGNEGLLYYWARVSPRLGSLPVNTRTFEQLKNSGNFRLIKNIETSNEIMSYYETIPSIRMLEDIFMREFESYKGLASKIFDPAVFTEMELKNGAIIRTDKNPALQSYDPALIKQLSVFAVYLNGSARGIMTEAKQLQEKSRSIISYLQREYHLK